MKDFRRLEIYLQKFTMFITAVCVLFFIKLRWSKNKSLFVSSYSFINGVNGAQQCDCWRYHFSSLVCVQSVACLIY